MAEPSGDLVDRGGSSESADCLKQLRLDVDREGAKLPLHVGPKPLDRVELGTVGRQIDGDAASIEDGLAYDQHLVDVEVVHDDDVAGREPRCESALHEPEERLPVDRGATRHQFRLLAEADCADEGDRLPRAERSSARHPLSAQRAGVLSSHPSFYERFVDEDEAANVLRSQEFAERFAPLAVLRRVAFEGDEGLFFREKPSRPRARWTPERLVSIFDRFMSAAASSATVASGISATIFASSSAVDPWIGEGFPPPRGRGSSDFVSRCSRRIRFTVAYPMPRSSAVSL